MTKTFGDGWSLKGNPLDFSCSLINLKIYIHNYFDKWFLEPTRPSFSYVNIRGLSLFFKFDGAFSESNIYLNTGYINASISPYCWHITNEIIIL